MERIGINDFRLYKGLSELSYSPDGKKLAIGATERLGTVVIYDLM